MFQLSLPRNKTLYQQTTRETCQVSQVKVVSVSFEPRIESGSIGSRTRARYEREPKKTEGFSIFEWCFFFFRCLLTFCGLFVMEAGITD